MRPFALGFGAVNGQDFRTRREPLRIVPDQSVSGSPALTQGRAGPAGVETAGREHGSCNHAVGVDDKIKNKFAGPLCRLALLLVSSPT